MSKQSVYSSEEYEKKKVELEKILKKKPRDVETLFRFAKLCDKFEKTKVLQLLEKIQNISPSYEPGRYMIARYYQKIGKYRKACEKFEGDWINSERFRCKSIIRNGECLFQQGFYVFALNLWNSFENFSIPHYKSNAVFNIITFHLLFDENFQKACEFLKIGKEIDPNNAMFRVLEIYCLIVSSGKISDEEITKKIETIYEVIKENEKIRNRPITFLLVSKLELLKKSENKYTKALDYIREGLSKSKESEWKVNLRGLECVILGKFEKFSELRNNDRNLKEMRRKNIFGLHKLLAYKINTVFMEFRATRSKKVYDELMNLCNESLHDEDLFEDIVVLHPKTLVEISRIYRFHKKNWSVGFELIKRADLLLPNNDNIKMLLNWYEFYYSGNEDKAIKFLENLWKKRPNSHEVNRILGDMYFKKKLFRKSLQFYQIAVENDEVYVLEIDLFEIKLRIIECYEFIDNRLELYKLLDELLEKLGKFENHHFMLFTKISIIDRNYKFGFSYFQKIDEPQKMLLRFDELDDYYNIANLLYIKLAMKEEILRFYDRYVSSESNLFYDNDILESISFKSKCILARSLVRLGEEKKGNSLFRKLERDIQTILEIEEKKENNFEALKYLKWVKIYLVVQIAFSLSDRKKYNDVFLKIEEFSDTVKAFLIFSEESRIEGYQKNLFREIGFLKAHCFEMLKLPLKAVDEYTKIISSIEMEEMEKIKDKIREKPPLGRERHDYYLAALDSRAHCYLELKNMDKAISDFSKLYHPDDPRSYLHLEAIAQICLSIRMVGQSLKYFSLAIEHLENKETRKKLFVYERRSLYAESLCEFENPGLHISEEVIDLKYILFLYHRGFILFQMKNYVQSIEDLNRVLDYFEKLEFPEKHGNLIKECLVFLGYSHVHITNGSKAVEVFSKMIKLYPNDDRGFTGRSKAYFVDKTNIRQSLFDLYKSVKLNSKRGREEKKEMFKLYLQTISRKVNLQIEAEFSLSKKLFFMFVENAKFLKNSFRIIFDDEDVPFEERCIFIHPLFCNVSEFLKREYLSKGIYEIRLGMKLKSNIEVWNSYIVVRDWIMCLGISAEKKEKFMKNIPFLEETFFLAKKFELKTLMCYLVRTFNPFIIQEFHDSVSFKTEMLKLAIRLILRNEVESMLFLSCVGFFRYCIDLDKRRMNLENFRTKKLGKQQIVDKLNSGEIMQGEGYFQSTKSDCEYLFNKGELSEKENEVRGKLVQILNEKKQEISSDGPPIVPINYIKMLLNNHPNFMKSKSDCEPSTVYELLLSYLWNHEFENRDFYLHDRDKKCLKVHSCVLLSRMAYFRGKYNIDDTIKNYSGKNHMDIHLDDMPNKVLELLIGFCYCERETVKNFDASNWEMEEYDELLELVKKYKLERLEIVLLLKYIKHVSVREDW